MTIHAAVARGRAAAESLMVDTATITRPGAGEPVFDPNTGTYTNSDPSTVYTGKCRVQLTDSLDVRAQEFGALAVNLSRVTVSIPIDATDVQTEDVVTITSAVHDPVLVGRDFTVQGVPAKTHATARRLEAERKDD